MQSRGLGDVYKRQQQGPVNVLAIYISISSGVEINKVLSMCWLYISISSGVEINKILSMCWLYTSISSGVEINKVLSMCWQHIHQQWC